MAKRRMFSLDVVDTDSFLDLPASSQSLYFHLGMRADDDGFVSSPKRITAMVGAAGDDLKLLIAKGFVIPFESGVCVIRDWKVNNYIQRDRYTPSIYTEEKQRLSIAENGRYGYMDTQCIQDVSSSDTQVREAKVREVKGNVECTAPPAAEPVPVSDPSPKEIRSKYGRYGWVKLTDAEQRRLLEDFGQAELARCIAVVDELAQSTGNKNRWKDWNLVVRRCHRDGWGTKSVKGGAANGKSTGDIDTRSELGLYL